jgi:tetratricopeptide (TPR) repeat protein
MIPTRIVTALILIVSCLPLVAIGQNNTDPALASQLAKARQLMQERRTDDAIVEYKRADEMSQGKSFDAVLGLAQAYRGTEAYLQAEATALRAVEVAPNKVLRFQAYWTAATSSMTQGEKTPEKFKDAEREIRAALEINPAVSRWYARYYLARLLLRQSRDEEAVAELKTFVSQAAEDRSINAKIIDTAQQLIDHPNRGHASIWGNLTVESTTSGRATPATVPTATQSINVGAIQYPALRDKLLKADALLSAQKYEDAMKEFKAANKISKENSYEAWTGLALAYEGLDAHKNAAEAALHAVQLATSDKLRAAGHMLAGVAFVKLGADKADRYKDGEREFRTALQLDPGAEFIHYNLGMALLKQSRDSEGISELQTYIAQHPNSARVNEAQQNIADPRRARETFIPDFSITTLDGQYISSSDLVGKVVVLDFWASWCGPCRSALGDLRSFAKHFAGKPVVVLSVSADRDKDTWRTFVQKNTMTWPQYYDEYGKIARLFGVHAFPSYFVIDGEGIVRRKVIGAGNFELGAVEDEVKKGLKKIDAAKKNAPAAKATPGS